jgi:alpha-glucosidase
LNKYINYLIFLSEILNGKLICKAYENEVAFAHGTVKPLVVKFILNIVLYICKYKITKSQKRKIMKNQMKLRLVFIGCILIFVNAQMLWGQYSKTKNGILFSSQGQKVELAVANASAFRLSVSNQGEPKVNQSIFIDTETQVPTSFEIVSKSPVFGIETSFGKLLFNINNNQWVLYDANGKFLISEGSMDVVNDKIIISQGVDQTGLYYGSGNMNNSELIKTHSNSSLGNGFAGIPYFWSTTGFSAFGVTTNDNKPAQWDVNEKRQTLWTFTGNSADLYLWPAKDLYTALKGYIQLTGKPKLPPRWAFGYLQSRWGWEDKKYIEDVIVKFRSRNLPVEAFIYDFEWYASMPDYRVKPQGEADFNDFEFNEKLFPAPTKQIAEYKKQGIKFIGIRKPRLGNTGNLDYARSRGWLINQNKNMGKSCRDLDFSNDSARIWYIEKMKPLIEAGVDAWWNDEGESYYSLYYWWNKAECDLLAQTRSNERHFSINRAFSPGNQRLGYCAWNGDTKADWKGLSRTVSDILNWSLAGMYYGSCDIGGFHGTPTKENLIRWHQAAVFFPIMRSHSDLKTLPHFPWLWGEDGENAMRKANNLRYRLLPYIYSLGHEAYNTGAPIVRPLLMEYPDDAEVVNLSDEMLLGKGLLVAPILTAGGKREVYLPKGAWYDFFSNKVIKGAQHFQVTKQLDEIPVYVAAGTILPLGPELPYSEYDSIVPLEIRVYPGQDGSFTMTEDDGVSYDYIKTDIRTTSYKWNDATRTLSWKVSGNYKAKKVFNEIRIVVGNQQKTVLLGSRGSCRF